MRRPTVFEFLNHVPILKGKSVNLRSRVFNDCVDEYRWRADEELCRLDATVPIDIPFAQFQQRYSSEIDHPGMTYTFSIDTIEGTHIGVCSLFNFNLTNYVAEMGIVIGEKAYWNRGYGTEALRIFLQHIFDASGINRILLRTLDWNSRAQRCFEKCGFKRCGNSETGQYCFTLMEILRPPACPA